VSTPASCTFCTPLTWRRIFDEGMSVGLDPRPAQYRDAIAKLGLSQERAGLWLGLSPAPRPAIRPRRPENPRARRQAPAAGNQPRARANRRGLSVRLPMGAVRIAAGAMDRLIDRLG
jgi:hypothetical protein